MSVEFSPDQREISSRLSQDSFSGMPYGMSDSLARNLGVSPNNPFVSRLANAASVFAIPILVDSQTGNPIGLGTRHLIGGASSALESTSHLLRTARELYNGQRDVAMLHAAQATASAYNAFINGLVIGGIYLIPDLQLIESAIAIALPSIARTVYSAIADAPNGLIASMYGIEKPYILRIKNLDGSMLEFPISTEEKQKLESKEFKHYTVVRNAENNGFEIKFLSDEEIRKAALEEAPAKKATPVKKAEPVKRPALKGVAKRRQSSRKRRSPQRLLR